jgi:hypothetical protein
MDPRELARAGIHSNEQAQRAFDRRVAQPWEQRRQALKDLDDPDMIQAEFKSRLLTICGVSLREQELRDDIQEYIHLLLYRMLQGHTVSYDETYEAINQIAEEHGFLSGVPIPIVRQEGMQELVMAPGVPLAEIFHMNQELQAAERRTEMEQELGSARIRVRNSWEVLGDKTICVIETDKGPMAVERWHAGRRIRKLVRGAEVRHLARLTAKAELKAIESLRSRINESQFNSYVVSGIFPEHSERSDLHYYFRKGLPVIAVSHHGPYKDTGRILCALCLHPMGYYQGTHAGLMTPTDEVIAQLLMLRADEHKFWAKSGQWSAEDTRAGI